ncbi:MAG: mycothiol synthase [Nakamurella sp.]
MRRGKPDVTPGKQGVTRSDTWQHGLTSVQQQQVRSIADAARLADGVAALSGHIVDALGSVDDSYLLIAEQHRLVGLAARHAGDPAELLVHPDFRGRGFGRTLLTASLATAGRVWAHGNLPAAQALSSSLRLKPVRTLLQMRRPLPAEHTWKVPAGVRLRTFVPGQDEEQFLAVNGRAFAWHPEQGRLDAAGLAAELAQDWFDPKGFFLAVDAAGTVLGFHWTKVHAEDPTPQGDTDQSGPIGEVYVLGVDPQSPIRRLGEPLTAAGLEYLAAQGLSAVMLYVECDNDKARRLYERWGFRVAVTDVVYAR